MVSSQSSATEIDKHLLQQEKLLKPLNPSVTQCQPTLCERWYSGLLLTNCRLPRPTHKDAVGTRTNQTKSPEQWTRVRWSNELSSCFSHRCHESLLGLIVPLYSFITSEDYEAILVHHFSIFQGDDVCMHTAKETEDQFNTSVQKSIFVISRLPCKNVQNKNTHWSGLVWQHWRQD